LPYDRVDGPLAVNHICFQLICGVIGNGVDPRFLAIPDLE